MGLHLQHVMPDRYFIGLCLGLCLQSCGTLAAQHLSFRPLGADEGMRATASWHCTTDRFGCLWVATTDGLVRYNGSDITYYYSQDNPELPSERFGFLFFDSRDNLWICTTQGLARMDENKRIHRQILMEEEPARQVNFCMEDSRGNITAISNGLCFKLGRGATEWIPAPWLDSLITGRKIRDCQRFDQDTYILTVVGKGAMLINLKTEKMTAFFLKSDISHASKLNTTSVVLSAGQSFSVYTGYLTKPDTLFPFPLPEFVKKGDLKTQVNHLITGADGLVYMTTEGSGLLRYNTVSRAYQQYRHDPANPNSPLSDNLRYICSDSLGNIAFTSLSGANFTNVKSNPLHYINHFRTEDGNTYDGRIVSLAEDSLRQIWVLMDNDIVVLDADRVTSRSLIFPENSTWEGVSIIPQAAAIDFKGNIWVAFKNLGLGIFGTDRKLRKLIKPADHPAINISLDNVRIMRSGDDGFMYLGTEKGFYRMHQLSCIPDTFPADTALWALRKERIVDILLLEKEWWISSSPNGGAWRYDREKRELKKFTRRSGLLSDRVYGLSSDHEGNIYIGSYGGLNIIAPDGQMQTFKKGAGLPSTRIDAIQNAADGSIWMTNTFNLLKYSPALKTITRVSGHSGFSRVNYQIMASTALSSGELAFGTHEGIVIVDIHHSTDPPDPPVEVYVFYKNAEGHEFLCQPDNPIRFTSGDKFVQFVFGINHIILANQMNYRYRLMSGRDSTWSQPSHVARVDFKLDPGTYLLEVEASDNNEWYRAPGPIRIKIDFPWWQRWWVILATVLAAGAGFTIYIRGRLRTYRNELTTARQIADLESKALRAQMNPHFVFNSLNAIQECIVTGRVEEAYTYLSKFSKLLRMVLEHSEVTEVSLHDELEVLSLYISLEKLRFMDDLDFELEVDSDLDADEVNIPPMLIQPHLENAIWHGLRHLTGHKKLHMSISEKVEGYLTVKVEDNGIGRLKANAIRQSGLGREKHSSKGKQLSNNRLELLRVTYPLTSMEIVDLYDDLQRAAGTRVVLMIPMMKSRTILNPDWA